ncbi:MAG TPA: ATP-binding protein [Verrucomicrobiae bacterium]
MNRGHSIHRRMQRVIVLTTGLSLVLACVVFVYLEWSSSMAQERQSALSTARITADACSAMLAFNRPEEAKKLLDAFRAEPDVRIAALYDAKGKLFAEHRASDAVMPTPVSPEREGSRVVSRRLAVFYPVIEDGKHFGTLFLQVDLRDTYAQMEQYAWITLLIFSCALGGAYFIGRALQRTISNPILSLAETAQSISREKDYKVRARTGQEGELDILTTAFNQMLDTIQDQQAQLRVELAERKRAQQSEAAERELLATTLESIGDAVIATNAEGKVTFLNGEAERLTGWSNRDAAGRPLPEVFRVISEESRLPIENPVDRVLKTGAVVGLKHQALLITKDGRETPIDDSAAPIRQGGGPINGVVLVFRDFTEKKQSADELKKAHDRLLAASRAKDDFLAALSHELRTPLNPVLLLASEAAEDMKMPTEVRTLFATIRNNVELEARLIDDLLDITRITHGKLVLNLDYVDVHSILGDAMAMVQAELDQKRITLRVRLGAEQPVMKGDAVRLQQVFWNVLKNAAKFTPEGGNVTVETATMEVNDKVSIRITDTGIGLMPEERERIFDAFSQGEHARGGGSHKFGGLGMGLTISRKLVELHGGAIQAMSEGPGKGAMFEIVLPVRQTRGSVDSLSETAVSTDTERIRRNTEKQAGLRVLLVEDHEATREALKFLLTKRKLDVTAAGTVGEAMRATEENTFDLVISDIGLPDGNGYELMGVLRRRYGLRGIALTGYGMEQDVAQSREAGFVAHLTKPVRMESLEKVLGEAVKG